MVDRLLETDVAMIVFYRNKCTNQLFFLPYPLIFFKINGDLPCQDLSKTLICSLRMERNFKKELRILNFDDLYIKLQRRLSPEG